jgi:hypothetical protein
MCRQPAGGQRRQQRPERVSAGQQTGLGLAQVKVRHVRRQQRRDRREEEDVQQHDRAYE